ncbi:MAG: tail fiber domain-containing protein, partial [Flavobacteriales bacterium]|nr:tail fiber domain-containing protein [Flavobacteriales bacterium]
GTTSPLSELHVNGSRTSYTGAFVGNTGTGAARIYMDASNGDFSGGDYTWIGQNDNLDFEIANVSPRITVKPDGKVGIGTASPSALLDVSSTTSGVLIPRVTLVQRNAIATPVTSELVFQTDNTPGYYYWDGTAWVQMLTGSGSGSGWATTGNAGLSAATNFLGTTDKVPLVFRTDNIERMRVDTTTGNVGIGTVNPVYPLHVVLPDNGSLNGIRFEGLRSSLAGHAVRLELTAPNSPAAANKKNFQIFNSNPNTAGGQNTLHLRSVTDAGATASNILSLTHDGNVGIGTTAPLGKLHVDGGSSAGTTPHLILGGGVAANDVSDLYVLDSKDLSTGVGYAAKVIGVNIQNQVDASNQVLQRTTWGGVTGSAAIYLGADDVNQGGFGILTAPQGSAAGTILTERFTVKGNGNVGIGTTAPTVKTHVFNTVDGIFTGLAIDNRKTYGAGTGINEVSRIILSLSEPATQNPLLRVMGFISAGTESEISSTEGFLSLGTRTATVETEKVRITSTGNVGIGTTSPVDMLHIYGTSGDRKVRIETTDLSGEAVVYLRASDADAQIAYERTGVNTGDLKFEVDNTGLTEMMRITSSGNVGIGTVSPGEKLEVSGGASNTIKVSGTGGAPSWQARVLIDRDIEARGGGIWIDNSAGTENEWFAGVPYNGGAASGGYSIGYHATQPEYIANSMLRITNAGNVGIGIGTPTGKLDVRAANTHTTGVYTGSGHLFLYNDQNNADELGAFLVFGSNYNDGTEKVTTRAAIKGGTDIAGNNGAGYLAFYTVPTPAGNQNTERMRIDQSGNVGIGTATPEDKLHIATTDVNATITLDATSTGPSVASAIQHKRAGSIRWWVGASGSGGVDNYSFFRYDNTGAFLGEAMTIERATGEVGIGTTTPGGQFELSLDQGRKPATNTWTIASDERLKNIEGAYSKGLEAILQLQPITYKYKNVGNRTFKEEVLNTQQVGFSAQEVRKIFPEAVGTDADGYLNFNMHAILVAYVNAIKELKAENEALKIEVAEISVLKNKVAEIDVLKLENASIKREIEQIKSIVGMQAEIK